MRRRPINPGPCYIAATIAQSTGPLNFVAGSAQSAGIVGIPAGDANTFFQESLAAAKLVEGQFSLYTGG